MLGFLGAIVLIALVFWAIEVGLTVGMVAVAWWTWTWIGAHPWQTAGLVAAYFLTGAVWSVVKWWRFEVKNVERVRREFKIHPAGRTWPEYRDKYKSDVAEYKGVIIMWIVFWPFSALWTLLDDPVRRLASAIYTELVGVYERISQRVWG